MAPGWPPRPASVCTAPPPRASRPPLLQRSLPQRARAPFLQTGRVARLCVAMYANTRRCVETIHTVRMNERDVRIAFRAAPPAGDARSSAKPGWGARSSAPRPSSAAGEPRSASHSLPASLECNSLKVVVFLFVKLRILPRKPVVLT